MNDDSFLCAVCGERHKFGADWRVSMNGSFQLVGIFTGKMEELEKFAAAMKPFGLVSASPMVEHGPSQ